MSEWTENDDDLVADRQDEEPVERAAVLANGAFNEFFGPDGRRWMYRLTINADDDGARWACEVHDLATDDGRNGDAFFKASSLCEAIEEIGWWIFTDAQHRGASVADLDRLAKSLDRELLGPEVKVITESARY